VLKQRDLLDLAQFVSLADRLWITAIDRTTRRPRASPHAGPRLLGNDLRVLSMAAIGAAIITTMPLGASPTQPVGKRCTRIFHGHARRSRCRRCASSGTSGWSTSSPICRPCRRIADVMRPVLARHCAVYRILPTIPLDHVTDGDRGKCRSRRWAGAAISLGREHSPDARRVYAPIDRSFPRPRIATAPACHRKARTTDS